MNSLDIFSKIYLDDIISEATIDYKKQLSQNNPAAMNSFMKSEIGLGKLIREMSDTPTPKFKKSSPTTMFYCEGISSSSRKPAKNFSKFMKSLKIKNFENLKSKSSFQTAISYLAPNIIFNETIDNSNKNYICGRNHVLDLFNESQLNDLMARTKKLIYSIFIYNKEKISNELKAQSSSSTAYAFQVAGMTITENTEDVLKYKIDWKAVPEEISSAEENPSSKSLKLSFRLADLNEKIKMQWKIFVNNVIDIFEEILVDNSDSLPNKKDGYNADLVEEYLQNNLEEYLSESSRVKFLEFIEVMLQMFKSELDNTYEIEFESTENEEASSDGVNSLELQTESSSMSNIAKEIEEQFHAENLKFYVKNESGEKLYFNPEPRARNYGVKLSDISNHINNSARKAIYESLGISKEEFKAKCLAYGEEICRSATERNIRNDTSEIAFNGSQSQPQTATTASSMNYKVTLSEDEIDNLLDQISRGYSKILDYDNIAMLGDRWIRKFYDEYKADNTLLKKQRLVALLKLVYNINPSLISKYNREKPEGYPSY